MKGMQQILLLLLLSPALFAKDVWSIETGSSGRVRLVCERPDGTKVLFSKYYLETDQVSDEVISQFVGDYPKLWKEAMRSSGNMHNPKVWPLKRKFSEVLLKTPTVKGFDKLARKSGFMISGASCEKFHLQKGGGKVKVIAMIWLKLEKVVEQGGKEPDQSNQK